MGPVVWELEGWRRDQSLGAVVAGKIESLTSNLQREWRTTQNCQLFSISGKYLLSVNFL